jgi:hypothetical protein
VDVPLTGPQGLLPRVGDEHLQDCLIHTVTAPTPLCRMPPILTETCTPRGDVCLHSGDDIRLQMRKAAQKLHQFLSSHLPHSGMSVSPRHPGSSAFLVSATWRSYLSQTLAFAVWVLRCFSMEIFPSKVVNVYTLPHGSPRCAMSAKESHYSAPLRESEGRLTLPILRVDITPASRSSLATIV